MSVSPNVAKDYIEIRGKILYLQKISLSSQVRQTIFRNKLSHVVMVFSLFNFVWGNKWFENFMSFINYS